MPFVALKTFVQNPNIAVKLVQIIGLVLVETVFLEFVKEKQRTKLVIQMVLLNVIKDFIATYIPEYLKFKIGLYPTIR